MKKNQHIKESTVSSASSVSANGDAPQEDPYLSFVQSKMGKYIARHLGLPQPTPLNRFNPEQPICGGNIKVAGGPFEVSLAKLLPEYHWHDAMSTQHDLPDLSDADTSYHGLVFDARHLATTADLSELYVFFHESLPQIAAHGRVIVIGTTPHKLAGEHRIVQRSLEGFIRSLAKELRAAATAQLIYCDPIQDARALLSTVRFLLSPKSAFIDGQIFRIDSEKQNMISTETSQPLKGKTALITGAARGIGATISRILAREGAHICAVDIAQSEHELQQLATELCADSLLVDIAQPGSELKIAEFIAEKYGKLDILVHNAGITRDKLLVNMDHAQWDSVIAVNLTAQIKIINTLLDRKLLLEEATIISISSIAGIAGNRGQTNYATSKAGIIGLVDAYYDQLYALGIRINAIAPGFIETAMTAKIPVVPRILGRLMSTLHQGGQPVDVAELVALYADPQSYALHGNVIRVCGQNMLGA